MCSWGGEEYGLIGSVEWVEQNAKVLGERAVTYINLDSAVSGNFVLSSRGSPLMKNNVVSWTEKVGKNLLRGFCKNGVILTSSHFYCVTNWEFDNFME